MHPFSMAMSRLDSPSNPPCGWLRGVAIAAAVVLAFPACGQAVEEFPYNVFWVHRTDVGTMGKRFGHAMAYDSSRGVTVFFGGEYGEPGESSSFFDDTWEYDGRSWKPVVVENGINPGARSEHTMVFDSANNQVVLFGGVGEDRYYNDTWTYVGTGPGTGRWTRRADLPGARRAGHAMVFDSVRIAVVVTGGKPDPEQIGYEQVSECWEWSPLTDLWRRLPGTVGFSGGSTLGAGLRDHYMVFDPKTGSTYVSGGRGPFGLEIVDFDRMLERGPLSDLFGFTLGIRVQRHSGAAVYLAHRDALVLYGGQNAWGELDLTLENPRFRGWPASSQPIRNFPTVHPPPRSRHAMVYDARRQVAVVFGGYGGPGFARHADTWELVSYVPGEIWVNFGHQGIENGTEPFPFRTLPAGVGATPDAGILRLVRGDSAVSGTFTRPMTWEAVGGPVTLGRR